MSKDFYSFGFIGAGRMAAAMIAGLLKRGVDPVRIIVSDGGGGSAARLSETFGVVSVGSEIGKVLTSSELVVLACKPQTVLQMESLKPAGSEAPLLVSVVAGVKIARLREVFPFASDWVRAMPNTPSRVGRGMTGWACRETNPDLEKKIENLFSPMGEVCAFPEDLIEAVTAISGSGPAYFFEFTRLLEEAAKAQGIDESSASKLARATLIGAAYLVDADERSLETLKNEVTSPGGTTEAALNAFAKAGLEEAVTKAVEAAAERGKEIADS